MIFVARPVPINSGRRVGAVFASNDQAASHTLPCSHEKIPLQLKTIRLDEKNITLDTTKNCLYAHNRIPLAPHSHKKPKY